MKNNTQLLNNTILLKREDTQPVFSFKIRGAYNKMASLPSSALSRGVVACSAGNHAQGVALSARMLGCRAVICMPLATPSIKVNSVRAHGGDTVEVRLVGNNYDEAAAEAKRDAHEAAEAERRKLEKKKQSGSIFASGYANRGIIRSVQSTA